MAYPDPKTKKWVGDSRITGYPRRKKRGFRTKREARKWEMDRRERILNPEPQKIQLKTSEACLQYLKHCKRRGFQINTYRSKTNIYKRMLLFWEQDHNIGNVDSILIENFLDHIFDVKSGKTANRYKREIKSLFNYLRKRHYVDIDPTSPIDDYQEKVFMKYVPPAEDIKAILTVANELESDIIKTTFFTAARSGEIRNIRINDIDLENNSLILWTRKRKNRVIEPDAIDISSNLKKILQKRMHYCTHDAPWIFQNPNSTKLSKNFIDKILPRLCKVAKIKPFGLHSIRHHVAVQLALKNWPLIKIQKLLRHKRATTTDIYLRSLIQINNCDNSILDEIGASLE